LDQWEFKRKDSEMCQEMYSRLYEESTEPNAPWNGLHTIETWISSKHNGFYDNTIDGVAKVNEFAATPSKKIYFFTMSFAATGPFPDIDLSPEELAALSKTLKKAFRPAGGINRFLPSSVLGGLSKVFNWSIDTVFDQAEVAKWVTEVASDHLKKDFGYPIDLPGPGTQVPRGDMLPVMSPTAYGMGGHELTPTELSIFDRLGVKVKNEDWQPNDGIVNTISMDCPLGENANVKQVKDLSTSEFE